MTAYTNLASAVLVAHQRHKGGCLCGWSELGKSHADHVAEILESAGALQEVPVRRGGGDCPNCEVHREVRDRLQDSLSVAATDFQAAERERDRFRAVLQRIVDEEGRTGQNCDGDCTHGCLSSKRSFHLAKRALRGLPL